MLLEQLLLFRLELLAQILNVAFHVGHKLLLVKSWLLLSNPNKPNSVSAITGKETKECQHATFKHVNN